MHRLALKWCQYCLSQMWYQTGGLLSQIQGTLLFKGPHYGSYCTFKYKYEYKYSHLKYKYYISSNK